MSIDKGKKGNRIIQLFGNHKVNNFTQNLDSKATFKIQIFGYFKETGS